MKLLIQMTLTSFTLLSHTATTIEQKLTHTKATLFWEIIEWLLYILIPLLGVVLNAYWEIAATALFVPSYCWKLFWHKDGRSLIDMLLNPRPSHPDTSYNYSYGCPRKKIPGQRHTHSRRWRRDWKRQKADKAKRALETRNIIAVSQESLATTQVSVCSPITNLTNAT